MLNNYFIPLQRGLEYYPIKRIIHYFIYVLKQIQRISSYTYTS